MKNIRTMYNFSIYRYWVTKLLCILCTALISTAALQAQITPSEEPNEIGSEAWLSLRLKKKINRHFTLSLRNEARIIKIDNDNYLIEPGVRYKFFKGLSASASYRLSGEKKKDGLEFKSRVNFDLSTNAKLGRTKLGLRLMYTDVLDVDGFGRGRNKLRLKADAEHSILGDRLTPYLGFEVFRNLELSQLERFRYTIGAELELTDSYAVNLSYRHEDFLEEALVVNIMSVSLKYKL